MLQRRQSLLQSREPLIDPLKRFLSFFLNIPPLNLFFIFSVFHMAILSGGFASIHDRAHNAV